MTYRCFEFLKAKCRICGNDYLENQLESGICEECEQDYINQYRYDFRECYELAKGTDDEINLNCFLASMFSKQEIETILFRELIAANKISPVDCLPFIQSDKEWFFDRVLEGVRQ